MRFLILAAMLPIAAGCSASHGAESEQGAPGTGATRSFAVADFTAVDLRGADDVDVRIGSGFSVRAEGDPEALDQLRIERRDTTLRIGRQNGVSRGRARISVTMPRIEAAAISGSGDLAVDRVAGPSFKAAVAGSGSLSVATLAVERAAFEIAGSGDVAVAGNARSLDVSIAGSGDVAAPGLTAAEASVSIMGSGDVRAAVNGAATVAIMGSGDVDLGPGARCQTSKMGSGSVRCGG